MTENHHSHQPRGDGSVPAEDDALLRQPRDDGPYDEDVEETGPPREHPTHPAERPDGPDYTGDNAR